MNLGQIMKNYGETKLTENGAPAFNTTRNSLLDLFSTIGALRSRAPEEIEDKFVKAFGADKELATKMAFYSGNVRGGLGERRTFRVILHWLALNHPAIVAKNIESVPYFNRWDSIFVCVNTPAEDAMWNLVRKQLVEDIQGHLDGKPISLLAKWLPSINTSSEETKALARKVIKACHFKDEKQYRQTLSKLRSYLNVVEKDMSAQKWGEINYEAVPSYAMKNYGSAFATHDLERWNDYLVDVNSGEKKVNASVLYPYDLVEPYLDNGWGPYTKTTDTDSDRLIEAQWKALPDYVEGDNTDILVMADISGSMTGRPMATSVGLSLYFAEHNTGMFANSYMTFSADPRIINIDPNETLCSKVRKVNRTGVGYNTNLEAAFNLILNLARVNRIRPQDMPKALVVISDMEIDNYISHTGLSFVAEWEKRFNLAGYELPRLVLWNVASRRDTFLTQDKNVLMVGGQSASTFKSLINGLEHTAEELMLMTLNDPMYDRITI